MNIPPPAFPPPSNASTILPDELIVEILLPLNVKSLVAMKCVCKSWNTLISHPVFVKMHLNLSKRNPHLALLSERDPSSNTRTISVSPLLQRTPDSSYRYFRFNSVDCRGIVGSCNGLICLHSYRDFFMCQRHRFYFWNPATRTNSETLLDIHELKHETISYGFGYDNSSDTYKAVILGFRKVKTTAKVFTLGHNIWRDIQSLFPVQVTLSSLDLEEFKYDGVYLTNSISWLFQKNHTTKKFLIVSLDLGTETFTQFLLPSLCDELPPDHPTLCVLMDSICFSHDFEGTHLVIWQMKEFGVQESWTQFLKISYEILDFKVTHFPTIQLLPLCLSENSATLILATKRGNEAILFSWRDNRLKKKIKVFDRIRWCTAKDYVESLVSTC